MVDEASPIIVIRLGKRNTAQSVGQTVDGGHAQAVSSHTDTSAERDNDKYGVAEDAERRAYKQLIDLTIQCPAEEPRQVCGRVGDSFGRRGGKDAPMKEEGDNC